MKFVANYWLTLDNRQNSCLKFALFDRRRGVKLKGVLKIIYAINHILENCSTKEKRRENLGKICKENWPKNMHNSGRRIASATRPYTRHCALFCTRHRAPHLVPCRCNPVHRTWSPNWRNRTGRTYRRQWSIQGLKFGNKSEPANSWLM